MSDPIAQAAQQLNEHQATEAGTAVAGEPVPQSSASTESPLSSPSTQTDGAPSSAQPSISQPAADTTAKSSEPQGTGEELPRESHLLLLEHKLAAMHAKFKTGERIVIDEFEQILGHIKAVL